MRAAPWTARTGRVSARAGGGVVAPAPAWHATRAAGRTILMLCLERLDMVQYILRKLGADPNIADQHGMTALHMAGEGLFSA